MTAMPRQTSSGLDRAWELLAEASPSEAARNAIAAYDEASGLYIMRVLGMDFSFDAQGRSINALTDIGAELLKEHGFFFEHAAVWYLACAKAITPTGRHIRPESLKGGHHFFKGAHELPLKDIASKYGSPAGREAFLARANALGGFQAHFGDAASVLHPLPRLPLILILWLGDEEFPPRADLLFDSSADYLVPLDVLWSAAMLGLRAML